MKRLRQLILASFVAFLGLTVVQPLAPTAGAIDIFEGACGGTSGGGSSSSGGSSSKICGAAKTDEAPDIIKNVINMLLVILGMIAVIMIVIGGIRYTTSNGDSGQVQSAKNTVLYAVVGLVVAIFAFAIVNFVLGAFS